MLFRSHDADGLVEAAELLGASIGAEAGWERVAIGAEVPVARIAPLLDLVAEIALSPRLPERGLVREQRRGVALRSHPEHACSPSGEEA